MPAKAGILLYSVQMNELVSAYDRELLIRDKYNGDVNADISEDLKRLAAGEPLAYVIGWIPFLGLKIALDSSPLIPRPETEWWTEKLIEHLRYRFEARPFKLLDLCAGSGAIGLAVLSHLPNAHVSFGEIDPPHVELIKKNLSVNDLSPNRADIRVGDLFETFGTGKFDIIASNPPYIPEGRMLETSVTNYEPSQGLFGGPDGMQVIRAILKDCRKHLSAGGELWVECDIENIGATESLVRAAGADETAIHEDLYGRPRLLVSHFA